MATTTTISQHLFNQKAKEAIAKQAIRKEIPLGSIEIVDEESIRYEDKLISISKFAFKDLIECLKLPKAFLNRFSETFGPENKRTFINRIKDAVSADKAQNVTLIVNPTERKVMRILGKGKGTISNESFVDFASRYIDQYNLSVTDFHVGDDGNININTLSPDGIFRVGSEKETFRTGMSFSNGPQNGLIVSPYLNRLVCTNGMVTRDFEETYKLNTLSAEKIEEFNKQMMQLQNTDFIPAGITEKINASMTVPASIAEMQKAAGLIMTNSKVDYKELQRYIPIESTMQAYSRFGVDTAKMTTHQMKNAKTGTTIWQLVNGITNFATHFRGDNIRDFSRSSLMIHAGGLLTKKTWDTENLITSPFDRIETATPDTGDRW